MSDILHRVTMEYRYMKILAVVGVALLGLAQLSSAAGENNQRPQASANYRSAQIPDRIRPPLAPQPPLQHRLGRPSRSPAHFQVATREVTTDAEKIAVVPRFSHQQGTSPPSTLPAEKREDPYGGFSGFIKNHRHSASSSVSYQKPGAGSGVVYSQPGSQTHPVVSGSSNKPVVVLDEGRKQKGGEVLPEYSFPPSAGFGGIDDDRGYADGGVDPLANSELASIGHSIIQKAFDDNLFSSEGDGSTLPGKQIDPAVASFYETGVRPNPPNQGAGQPDPDRKYDSSHESQPSPTKSNPKKSTNRDDLTVLDDDDFDVFSVDVPSSSYGNDIDPALFLNYNHNPQPVYRPPVKQPDYIYKFKFYPAVGYHKGAKIIYLDDYDYYHPYYTPGGYESLKTVKKSVSKIQKELKKATKFQPHYDHLYGKGRVKHYLISKPPSNYGPGYAYGAGKKPYHQPHPVTKFPGEDYLNYDSVEFDDREGKEPDHDD